MFQGIKGIARSMVAAAAFAAACANAGPIELLKDINRTVRPSGDSAGGPVPFGTSSLVSFVDGTGCTAWLTDGTTAGSVGLHAAPECPRHFTVAGSSAFFIAAQVGGGPRLFKTDGTAAGTAALPNVFAEWNYPSAALGSSLVFVDHLLRVMITDGGVPTQLKALDGAFPNTQWLLAAGSQVFFVAYQADTGVELWKTDGTVAGTALVKDIYPGPPQSGITSAVATGGKAHFVAYDEAGPGWWVSDGTEAGTVKLLALAANARMAAFQGEAYLVEHPVPGTMRLWRSNGTPAGTQVVYSWSAQPTGVQPIVAGAYLYLVTAETDNGKDIWRTDGTNAGTIKVYDSISIANPTDLTAIGQALYFRTPPLNQLWKTLGDPSSTTMVSTSGDMVPKGALGSVGLFSSNNRALVGDGTTAGSTPLVTPAGSPNNGMGCVTTTATLSGVVFFFADDGFHGCELWKTDGTEAGTQLVRDINPGTAYSIILDPAPKLVTAGGLVYFVANDGTGREVWRSDGTAAGTFRVSDTSASGPSWLTAFGSSLYFLAAQVGGSRQVLWKSDGTVAGTVVAVDLPAGAASSPYFNLTAGDDRLFFTMSSPDGVGMWMTDGTSAGTDFLRPLAPFETRVHAAGSRTFFLDPSIPPGLWVSDGTIGGTEAVDGFILEGDAAVEGFLGTAQDRAVFYGPFTGGTREVWASDGTVAGTEFLGRFAIGEITTPNALRFDGDLHFVVGNTVYATDGTASGTRPYFTNPDATAPRLHAAGPALFFSTPIPGNASLRQLWATSGTTAGTVTQGSPLALIPAMGAGFVDTGMVMVGAWGDSGFEAYQLALDATPDAPVFPSAVDVAANGAVISQPVQVLGINVPVEVNATNGQACVSSASNCACDLEPFGASVTAGLGQFVCVRHVAAAAPSTAVATVLSVGGIPASFTSTTEASTYAGVRLSAASYSVAETGTVALEVQRIGAGTGALEATWATSSGSASAGVDYGVWGNPAELGGTLTWGAGDFSSRTLVIGGPGANVALVKDLVPETPKTFTVSLQTAGVVGAPGSATVTIVDDDRGVGFSTSAASVGETGANAQVTVTRTGDFSQPLAVTFSTANGSANAGTDFGLAGSGFDFGDTLHFLPGEQSKVIEVGPTAVAGAWIPVFDDGAAEPNETFSIFLNAASGGTKIGSSQATITIVTTDVLYSMASSVVAVGENAGNALVTVNRVGAIAGVDGAVSFATSNGTAAAGTHYTAQNGQLVFGAGESVKSIAIPIIDNGLLDPTRSFHVTLGNPVAGTLTSATTTRVDIGDDDNTVQLSAASASVAEGAASHTFTVVRTGAAPGPVSVQWSLGGTATAGEDFGGPIAGTLEWAADDLTVRNVVVPLLNDAVPELPETLVLALSDPVNARLGSTSTSTLTISDTDRGFAFAQSGYTVAENGAAITLKVRRIGPASGAATVRWATSNVSAIAGEDFGTAGSAAQRSGALSWATGDAAEKSIVIPILQDSAHEGVETFAVELSTPSTGNALGIPATTIVTINDDDIPAESSISFASTKALVLEGAGNVTLTLRRQPIGGGFTGSASVSYATVAESALATSDFLARAGTVTWEASDATNKTIVIPLVDNAVAEAHESFQVTIAAASPGLVLESPHATVTIIDDDEAFPAVGAVPDDWTVPVGAAAGWHVSNEPGAYEGVFSLRSDAIEDNQQAQIEITRDFPAGNVTFRVKVSSEERFDKLRFFIDGVEAGSWSGTAVPGWQTFTAPVSAGTHTLRWSYEKDASAAIGYDAAWIDAVTLP